MNVINKDIEDLIQLANNNQYRHEDLEKIRKAIVFVLQKHDGQFRKSGEPYIIHPIATAKILLNWKMDVSSVIAGLLHDVLEDTITKKEEIIDNFGNEIFTLVNYVTKVSLYSKQNRQDTREKSEIEKDYIIQVFLSMTLDLRAMIIKLADRYHNMTTIKYLHPEKQRKIAQETLEIYSKVAGRIGMYKLKTILEDISFAVLEPNEHDLTKNEIDDLISSNESIWNEVKDNITHILTANGISFTLKKRIKGIYSTWLKVNTGHEIKDIHDIYAIRIVVDNVLDCYKVLGFIHLNFNYLTNAFKDYISNPKFNLYQSIHTTIIKSNALLEVQIRTTEMDNIAEYGIASHWSYKDNKKFNVEDYVKKNQLIYDLIQNPKRNSEDIKKLTNDVVFEVFVLNNEKKLYVSSKNKCIDLAFQFDNNNFCFLKNIYINGLKANFDSLLQHGDVVKFEYDKISLLNKSWINYCNSQNTINFINEKLEENKRNKIININKFYTELEKKLGKYFIGRQKVQQFVKNKFKVESLDEFLSSVPLKIYNSQIFINIFDKRKSISKTSYKVISKKYPQLVANKPRYFKSIDGVDYDNLSFPNCCNKIPFMHVVGILTKKKIIEVHDYECKHVKNISKTDKIYPLTWDNDKLEKYPRTFRYQLTFETNWFPSLGNIITKYINKYRISLVEIKIDNSNNKTCNVNLILYVSNLNWLKIFWSELNKNINVISLNNF